MGSPVCKCCGGRARIFADYSFSRTCEDRGTPVFPESGARVPYYRCAGCGFVFTDYFDSWSSADMAQRIYNEDYALADPDFAEVRPRYIARSLHAMFDPVKNTIRHLDYGGGAGKLSEELKACGFKDSRCFDPYFSPDARPTEQFNLVTAYEVIEHAVDPVATFRDALSCVSTDGVLLFSTQLQNRKPDPDWWYIAPRNGHVSIHSYASLQHIAAQLGVQCLTLGNEEHLMYRKISSPLAHHIAGDRRKAALYAASRRSLGSFSRIKRQFSQLGFPRQRGDIRHWTRAILHSIAPA